MAKAFPGQPWRPPRADQQNAWDESAEFFALKKRLRDKIPDQRMPVPTELDVIKVKNATGGDRNESEVVELSDAIIDEPTRLHPWLNAIRMTSRCARYGVLRYATKANQIRWCQVSGPTFALVDLTEGLHRCSPKKDTFHFVGDDDGPIEILWRPDETSGVHECLVEMEQVVPPSTYVARIPDEGIEARVGLLPGRAVCKIYKLYPHEYTGPEAKSLQPITKSDGSILTKEIYNTSLRAIQPGADDLYLPIHREECGNWIVSDVGSEALLAEAILAEDMCAADPGGSGSGEEQLVQVTDALYLPDCTPFEPAKVVNPRNHRGPAGSKVLLVRKRCVGSGSGSGGSGSGSGEGDEEWQVFDVELRKYCAVIGLADRPTCLVMAGLQLAGEWCPEDEPIAACPLVEYSDCGSGSVPECDTTWSFEPLFACCGQAGSGSGG